MGTVMEFLINNYIYFVFVAAFLILALIGYIVDTAKTEKLKTELSKKEQSIDIPLASFGENITLGETVNKMTSGTKENVNPGIDLKLADTTSNLKENDVKQ
jgi:hypothetical protein